MAAFEKGHEKLGGRKKGVRNKASASVKDLLAKVYSEDDFIEDFELLRKSKDDRIRLEILKLALSYQYGKPVQPVVGDIHRGCQDSKNEGHALERVAAGLPQDELPVAKKAASR